MSQFMSHSLSAESAEAESAEAESAIAMPAAIQRYFNTINAKEFAQASVLFAEEGQLFPPFDKPVQGREAIAQYLTKEASDMTFSPSQCAPTHSEIEQAFTVQGTVKNSLFSVNVSWLFVLNASGEIESVRVKLLAKLEALIKLKR